MAALILPSRRVVQPQGSPGVDFGNPLARGLYHLDLRPGVNQSVDFGPAEYTIGVGSVENVAGQNGRGLGIAAEGANYLTYGAIGQLAPPYSIVIQYVLTVAPSTAVRLFGNFSASSYGYNFAPNATNGRFLVARSGANTTLNGGAHKLGVVRTVVGVVDATTVSYYEDGVLVAGPTAHGGVTTPSGTLRIGRDSASVNSAISTTFATAIYTRALSAHEVSALTSDRSQIWQLARPIQRRIWVPVAAGGGAVDLVTQAASHAHTAENVALTTDTALSADSATHAQTADSLTLATTTAVDLAVADASHAHAADSVALVVASVLVVAAAEHAHTAESVALATVETLTVAGAEHAHSAENLALTIGGIGLAVSDATHAQAAEAPALSADSFLVTADANHGHTADLLTLSTATFFAVDDAVHAQTADNILLDGAPTLQVAAADHQHTAETVALTMESWLEAANATHAHTAQNITLSVVVEAEPLTNAEMRELLETVRALQIQLQAVNGYTSLIPALL